MKYISTLAIACVIALQSNSQNVGIGTPFPHPSAALEVSAPDKGMLVPRLNSGQRSSIPSPAAGLLVFDTDTNTFWVHNGSAWTNLSPTALSGSSNAAGLNNVAIKANNTHPGGIGLWSITSSNDANMVVSNSGTGDIFRGFSGPSAGNLVARIHNNGSITTTGNIGIGTSVIPTAQLEVNGNIKLVDGNQGINKVLTSDASGTGVWKSPPGTVAFRGLQSTDQNLSPNTEVRLLAQLEDYDASSNYNISTFTAPETGFYHFDVKVTIGIPITENTRYSRFYLRLKGNGALLEETAYHNVGNSITTIQSLTLNTNVLLAAGTSVTIHYYADAQAGSIPVNASDVKFTGFKVN